MDGRGLEGHDTEDGQRIAIPVEVNRRVVLLIQKVREMGEKEREKEKERVGRGMDAKPAGHWKVNEGLLIRSGHNNSQRYIHPNYC
jgi:hypothetical protein